MSDRQFIDTNIWLYALGNKPEDTDKRKTAQTLIATCMPVISIQVVNELNRNLLAKANFQESDIRKLNKRLAAQCEIHLLDWTILHLASDLRLQMTVSFWDSMILASALHSGAQNLYSEDMNNGQVVMGKLQILNPFIQ